MLSHNCGNWNCNWRDVMTLDEMTQNEAIIEKKKRTFSDEHKAKISAAKKGKTFSDEHKAKLSAARKGKEPWNKGLRKQKSCWFCNKMWMCIDCPAQAVGG